MPETFGKYHIHSELGKGGFATVYRAVDTTLDREVALKVLDPLLMRDATWAERFRREAKMIAALKHPAIVSIYEVNEVEGRLYLAMELAAGGSLAGAIAARGRLPWAETLALLKPVCEALDYAHGQGVIHRDLKPANILLTAEGQPLLTDFGFARLLGDNSMSLSLSGGIMGTPAYIAPEVWELDAADAPADIYALGCIIYEVMTGEVLFQSKTPMQAVRAHDQGPKYTETWPEGTPDGLAMALNKALARDPATRYPTAGTFWHVLNALEAQAETARQAAQLAAVAAQWRAETESAIQAGEWSAAKLTVGRWLKVVPGDKDALVAQQQIEAAVVEQARKQHEAEQERQRLIAEQERQKQVAAQIAAEVAQRRAETVAAMQAGEWSTAKLTVERWLKIAPGDENAIQAQQQVESALVEDAQQRKTEVPDRARIPISPLSDAAETSKDISPTIPMWIWGVGVLFLLVVIGGGWLLDRVTTIPQHAATTIALNTPHSAATSAAMSMPTSTLTATPQPTKTPTATPQPTRTSTATPGPNRTATAQAQAIARATTTAARVYATATAVTERGTRVWKPTSGRLTHETDNLLELYSTDLRLTDFIAEVTFHNPYGPETGCSDYGLLLRYTPGSGHAVYFSFFEDQWGGICHNLLANGTWNIVECAKVRVNAGKDESNTIRIIATGTTGQLWLNGEYITELDLSKLTTSGTVRPGIGFEGCEINGYTTRFENFTLWSLD